MAHLEIDSFVLKFKNLLQCGKTATLTIKSDVGRAQVTLSAELGDAPLHHVPGHAEAVPQVRTGPRHLQVRRGNCHGSAR